MKLLKTALKFTNPLKKVVLDEFRAPLSDIGEALPFSKEPSLEVSEMLSQLNNI